MFDDADRNAIGKKKKSLEWDRKVRLLTNM